MERIEIIKAETIAMPSGAEEHETSISMLGTHPEQQQQIMAKASGMRSIIRSTEMPIRGTRDVMFLGSIVAYATFAMAGKGRAGTIRHDLAQRGKTNSKDPMSIQQKRIRRAKRHKK